MAEQSVLVIGLDGATFDIVRPWAEAGILPTLSRLLAEGTSTPLVSTIPPVTGPAWSTFATGNHPGKHGNLDFRIKGEDYTLHPISSNTIRCETIWDILSRAGRRIGVVNVPVTYPPRSVNGLMVSGMLTPSLESSFTHPPDLKKEIKQRWPDYTFAVPWREYEGIGVEALLNALRHVTEQRRDLVLYCMRRESWDFFMAVFVGMDRVQHCLWRFMDPQHPAYDPDLSARYLPLIQDYYRFLDEVVADVISAAPSRTNIILMSDHGFGPLWKEVDLNHWLASERLLVYHSTRQDVFSQVWRGGRRIARSVPFLSNLFRGSYGKRLKHEVWKTAFSKTIDWAQTQVYCHAHGGLFINLVGRESQGIVPPHEYESLRDDLIQRVQKITDPETDQKIVFRAQRREEVYSGSSLDLAPDVIITEADEQYYFGFIAAKKSHFLNETHWKSGYHRKEGIFIAHGPNLKAKSDLSPASIADLAPTILYLLDVPIPPEIDGTLLRDVLDETLLEERPPSYRRDGSEVIGGDSGLDADDETLLVERLRDLGYL